MTRCRADMLPSVYQETVKVVDPTGPGRSFSAAPMRGGGTPPAPSWTSGCRTSPAARPCGHGSRRAAGPCSRHAQRKYLATDSKNWMGILTVTTLSNRTSGMKTTKPQVTGVFALAYRFDGE